MSNLIDIQTQIETLQKQANEIRSREFDKTVMEIRSTMQAFGITLKNLQLDKKRDGAIKKIETRSAKKRIVNVANKKELDIAGVKVGMKVIGG